MRAAAWVGIGLQCEGCCLGRDRVRSMQLRAEVSAKGTLLFGETLQSGPVMASGWVMVPSRGMCGHKARRVPPPGRPYASPRGGGQPPEGPGGRITARSQRSGSRVHSQGADLAVCTYILVMCCLCILVVCCTAYWVGSILDVYHSRVDCTYNIAPKGGEYSACAP